MRALRLALFVARRLIERVLAFRVAQHQLVVHARHRRRVEQRAERLLVLEQLDLFAQVQLVRFIVVVRIVSVAALGEERRATPDVDIDVERHPARPRDGDRGRATRHRYRVRAARGTLRRVERDFDVDPILRLLLLRLLLLHDGALVFVVAVRRRRGGGGGRRGAPLRRPGELRRVRERVHFAHVRGATVAADFNKLEHFLASRRRRQHEGDRVAAAAPPAAAAVERENRAAAAAAPPPRRARRRRRFAHAMHALPRPRPSRLDRLERFGHREDPQRRRDARREIRGVRAAARQPAEAPEQRAREVRADEVEQKLFALLVRAAFLRGLRRRIDERRRQLRPELQLVDLTLRRHRRERSLQRRGHPRKEVEPQLFPQQRERDEQLNGCVRAPQSKLGLLVRAGRKRDPREEECHEGAAPASARRGPRRLDRRGTGCGVRRPPPRRGRLRRRLLQQRGGREAFRQRDAPGQSSKMLGGASQIVSMIRVKCNGT